MEKTEKFSISGQIIDVVAGKIFGGTVTVANGIVESIVMEHVDSKCFILPGLIDAHIHVESSMLIPSEFARLAVIHGTVASVSDPHEIANVLGIPGVKFMIENGEKVPFQFYFGAPSCVPATGFETAGAFLGAREVGELLSMPEIRYLSEMMNFPGVLFNDPEVKAKLNAAKQWSKPVDGHAPGLRGEQAETYIKAGISTDHECTTLDEAVEKIGYGMHILLREGSAARDFEILYPLIDMFPEQVMLCSDDKHPNDLLAGHINQIVRRGIEKGLNIMNLLKACTLNPIRHYGLPTGLLQVGDQADFIVIDNLATFNVLETYIHGKHVSSRGTSLINPVEEKMINKFCARSVSADDLKIQAGNHKIRVMNATDGQLITNCTIEKPKVLDGYLVPDSERDILKIVVLNRYEPSLPAVGMIHGFGLKNGAMASCVAHDSHNIVAVGTDDQAIVEVINLIVEAKGGISMTDGNESHLLPLPVAGIMSNQDAFNVAERYDMMDRMVKKLGTSLSAPFMTLSFMALLVIPELKLSDRGLFDGTVFSFTELSVE
jgi:adenine deaminase